MADLLERASRLIQSEGFTGAHSFIFLTRYAALQGDRALLRTIGDSLEELSTLPESAALAYAYAEYFEAAKGGFCPAAAEFLLTRASEEDPMLLPALAKCSRVFENTDLLERAIDLADEREEDPFAALGFLEQGSVDNQKVCDILVGQLVKIQPERGKQVPVVGRVGRLAQQQLHKLFHVLFAAARNARGFAAF